MVSDEEFFAFGTMPWDFDPIERIWIPRCFQPSVHSKTPSFGLENDLLHS